MGKIGEESFNATAGVRQGGSLSCPLFTFLIDSTIEAINNTGRDGWLEMLHCLLLMDDTTVFATSRYKLIQKLQPLKRCTDSLDMVIHPTKSKYLCINTEDKEDIVIDEVSISATEKYVYLVTPILNGLNRSEAILK